MTLLCCLFIQSKDTSNTTNEAQNISSLLHVEPKFIYYSDGKFHVNLVGQLRMDILIESIKDRLLDYDLLIIDSLVKDLSTEIYLNWLVEDQPHSLLLNHGSRSINDIDFKTNDSDKINDLHLMVTSDMELGVDTSRVKQLYFNSIYLDAKNNQNSIAVNLNQWLNFTPVEIKSINGYSNYNDLHLENLLYRLMIWLLINVALYFLLKIEGKHIIISSSLAWFIAVIPFLMNFLQQHVQISEAYQQSSEFINKTDQDMFHLAESIQSEIESNSDINVNQQKFIILGLNNFASLRLFYHLSGLNIAISSKFISIQNNPDSIIYIMIGNNMEICNNHNKTVTPISQQADYCLAVSK